LVLPAAARLVIEMSTNSPVTRPRRRVPTVAVVGAGRGGAALTNALVLLQTADRIVLYNRHLARAEGEVFDLADATPLLHDVEPLAREPIPNAQENP
jgi:hypothetical protein